MEEKKQEQPLMLKVVVIISNKLDWLAIANSSVIPFGRMYATNYTYHVVSIMGA